VSRADRLRRAALCVALGMIPGAAPARAADGELEPNAMRSYSAHVVRPTVARTAPDSGSDVRLRVPAHTSWTHGPMTLLVLDDHRDEGGRRWLRVRLPVRPNDASGWISSDVVRLSRNPWRIKISTRRRTVTVLRAGAVVHVMRAVIGKPRTPTPHGLFAIHERAPQADRSGFVGPWALHLTSHSDVLTNYGGGPGRVAIHGRSGASLRDPLGSARSHGCVRVTNDDVSWLARNIRVGTPVLIGD
jgi:L,D-transpeptidase catalytic domain